MLAVILQYFVVAFAESRASSLYYLTTTEESPIATNADATAIGETLKRCILHWASPNAARKTGVVDDTSVADVDAVMRIKSPRCDQMRAEWRLLVGAERPIAKCEAELIMPIVERANFPSHVGDVKSFLDQWRSHIGADRSVELS